MIVGEWKEALAMITHSLQIHPYQPMGYYIRGDCYMKIKDYVSAALELEKYLKVAKPTKEVLQNLGKCKATNQDLEGAIACFTQIIGMSEKWRVYEIVRKRR
jgi:tetratricopeptide (TPR) repeat protein